MVSNKKDVYESLMKRHLAKQQVQPNTLPPCPDENMLAAYLERALTWREKEDFEQHASMCSRCQEELAFHLRSPTILDEESARSAPLADSTLTLKKFRSFFSLEWIKPAGIRPALAVVVVSLISGVIGYRVIHDKVALESPAQRITDSLKKGTTPLPDKDQSPTSGQTGMVSAELAEKDTNQKNFALKSIPASVPAKPTPVPQSTGEDLKKNAVSRDDALKQPAAAAPSSFEPSASNLFKEAQRVEQLDVASQRPSVPAIQGEYAGKKTSSLAGGRLEESRDSPKKPAIEAGLSKQDGEREKSQQEIPHQDSEQLNAPRRAQEKTADKLSSGLQAGAVGPLTDTRPKAANESKAVASPSELSPSKVEKKRKMLAKIEGLELRRASLPNRIEVAGKVFELRDGVWKDLSIEENETFVPIILYKNSPDFKKRVEILSVYQPILSRPENCMIKHEGKIYQIKQAP